MSLKGDCGFMFYKSYHYDSDFLLSHLTLTNLKVSLNNNFLCDHVWFEIDSVERKIKSGSSNRCTLVRPGYTADVNLFMGHRSINLDDLGMV